MEMNSLELFRGVYRILPGGKFGSMWEEDRMRTQERMAMHGGHRLLDAGSLSQTFILASLMPPSLILVF